MKFHLIAKRDPVKEVAEFSLSTTSSDITFTRLSDERTVTLSKDDLVPGDAVIVHWSPVYGFLISAAQDLINDKDLSGYLAYAKNVESNIAVVAMHSQKDEAAVVLYTEMLFDEPYVLSDRGCSTAEAIDVVFEGASISRMKQRNAKVELLRGLSAHDSLSALEKQVDLLSHLVCVMAADLGTQSEIAPLVKGILDAAGAVDPAQPAAAAEKITAFKMKLRERQATYFQNRA